MSKTLTTEQVMLYDLHGYLVIDNVLTENEIAQVLTVMKSHSDDKFSAIMNLDRKEPIVRELVTLPIIVAAVEQLQRWEIDSLMTQILFKEAGSAYCAQAWNPHQDNAYPRLPYPLDVTTNLFLNDADPKNGGLYLYPGSQREKLLPSQDVISHREPVGTNPGRTLEIPQEYINGKFDLIIKAGSLLIMNSHLIHGSYPNNSKRSRCLFSTAYGSKGVDVKPGGNSNKLRMSVRPHVGKYLVR